MARPKGSKYGPQAETVYIIGEVQHLASCGMAAQDIAKVLKKSASGLSKMLYVHGENELAQKFNTVYWQERNKK